MKWTDAGSKEYLRAFVLSSNQDWFGVNSLCSQLKVKIVDCSKCNCLDTAFLGAGATGRVVAVDREDFHSNTAGNGTLLALKICQFQHASTLEGEFSFLRDHSDRCGCDHLVKVVGNSITTTEKSPEFPVLCGFLMETVGTQIGPMKFTELSSVAAVFFSLLKLHSHVPPIIHGDARLSNLIKKDEKLIWINVMVRRFGAHSVKHDMQTLISSMKEALNVEVVNWIDKYVDYITVSSQNHSATATEGEVSAEFIIVELSKCIQDQMLRL